MSIAYSSAKLLLKFKTTEMTLEDYLSEENELNNEIPAVATDLTKEELTHEHCHANEWTKVNIRSSFHRDADGHPFTAPNEEDFLTYIVDNEITKDQLLKLYLDVVEAPLKAKLKLDGTDLKFYKILKGEIKTNHDLAMLEAGS